MDLRLILGISLLLIFSKSLVCAKGNSEHDSSSMVESMKAKLLDLEADVQKQYENGKLKWQMEAFQNWFSDTQKCSRFPSYIFNDWTIVQRRSDNSENFHRNWEEYRNGFGHSDKDFFMGLEQLHRLTTEEGPQELLIILGDHEGNVAFAKYDNFVVADERKKYELKELGHYTGDAGDSLRYHVGKKFSTFDQDNNDEVKRCENVWTGAWWFGACFESNLNGNYLLSKSGYQVHKGIVWEHWHGPKYSLKFVQMMIKPKV